MERTSADHLIGFCLKKIAEGQSSDGEFRTLLFFPERAENGWIYSGPSVFITASIGISLLNCSSSEAISIREKAATFVRSQMEERGLFRFYPHNGLFRFNTPSDVDDTSLASFLLKACGVSFSDNRKLLLGQKDRKGNFLIWFLPRLRYLTSPKLLWFLVADLRHSLATFFPLEGRTQEALISYGDHEHAVNANVLLYLGKSSETQKSINNLTEDLLFSSDVNQLFYPDLLFTYFHVSRAYHRGIQDFGNLRERVLSYVGKRQNLGSMNVFRAAVSLLTLLNFVGEKALLTPFIDIILETSEQELLSPYAYFCTKDRNMVGGSSELTCAFVLEALERCRSLNT